MSFLVLVLAVWIEKFSALRQRLQRCLLYTSPSPRDS